ncbi:NAD(P)/FAD-dependent oxidoreductase [Tunicatimonas pelagia]|uniref:NAD(P)/FAD-dependent oxidoreductase n=1 Tax=Tunicatimonas pelagia TaxID=931531 RepID=UPI002666C030|nr:NAD(P)/FAD-dependent oxidoreductase [Tunicatimonas pelagia]WKN46195.1 NAD(P)/FAD-dependent oxidoreductase [Tunicatimonas pelagia]
MAIVKHPTDYTISQRNLTEQLPDIGKPRVIIIGGGFAGIQMVKHLRMKDVQVVMLDRHNYHTFQPLLYQVATAGLEPDSIAGPLRKVFDNEKNFFFRMARVERIDPERQQVHTNIGEIHYDYLVVAAGTQTNYFGNEKIQKLAFPLKQVPQALNLRSHILQNFEKAVTSNSEEEIDRLTNFVIVGGGPTGVELAGALGELKKYVLPRDYPELDFKIMKVYLVEGVDRLLPSMSEKAGQRAERDLTQRFETIVKLETMVKDYSGYEVTLSTGEKLISETLIWAAGVQGVIIPGLDKATVEKGRYEVNEINRVKGYDNVFAVGDVSVMYTDEDYPKGHPQVAPVAMQQGEQLGKNLNRLLKGKETKPFSYFDKGSMATIGRNRAVADLPGNIKMSGLLAWLSWMFVHLMFLVSFRQKLITLGNWVWNYFTYDRGTRLIIRPFNYRRTVNEQKEELEEHRNDEQKETHAVSQEDEGTVTS